MLISNIDKRIKQYLDFLDRKKYQSILKLSTSAASTKKHYRIVPNDLKFEPIQFPYSFGKDKWTWWFVTECTIPTQFQSGELYLYAPTGVDSLVFINNDPSAAVNPYHEKVKLQKEEIFQPIQIAIEAYSGHIIPGYHPMTHPRVLITLNRQVSSFPIVFPTLEIWMKVKSIYKLYYDVLVLYDLSNTLDENSLRKHQILFKLYNTLMKIHITSDHEQLLKQVNHALMELEPLLTSKNGDTVPTIPSVGYAHLDHAWLWTISETIRKAARTYANMTRYMEEFPEFIFIQSQPEQLALIQKYYPTIFDKVLKAIGKNQWELNGGMYVEADCNLPNGESLIRQFLEGYRYTKSIANYQSDTLWLPDVFGYSAALPQILIGCEIQYFVTMKINWNDTTRFPYDTFVWEGIDGTRIPAHFLTTSYTGKNTIPDIAKAWNKVQHKEVQDTLVRSIGEGDGGGGVMRSDLEIMKRISDLEGSPKTYWSSVTNALQKVFRKRENLPVWKGELYLELHRGTYTTQAKIKQYNRVLEQKLLTVEFLSTITSDLFMKSFGVEGLEYPHNQLQEDWRQVLVNQFHDILPGSSIKEVYVDAIKTYEKVTDNLTLLIEDRLPVLSSIFDTKSEQAMLVVNSLSWETEQLILLPENFARNKSSIKFSSVHSPIQTVLDHQNQELRYAKIMIPSLGSIIVHESEEAENPSNFVCEGSTIETQYYNVEIDKSMRITSLIERNTGFEYVKSGQTLNRLMFGEDIPTVWDAWDIDWDYYTKLAKLGPADEIKVVSEGPLFLRLRATHTINDSHITQDMVFYNDSRRIDFITNISWNEEHKMLKSYFDTSIYSQKVKCEIQYGHLERSTAKNRDHEKAMFEICAHKWVSLNDNLNGIAILNSSKYGHSVTDDHIELTLLRSPKKPDPTADIGTHQFTYSILPYQGSFSVEKVVRPSYELNRQPLGTIFTGYGTLREFSLATVDNSNIIIEVVKQGDSGGGIVMRLYEALGVATSTTLYLNFPFTTVDETNMLEKN